MAHGRIDLDILDLGAPIQLGDERGGVRGISEPLDLQQMRTTGQRPKVT